MTAIDFELLRDIDGLRTVEADWNRLSDRVADSNFFRNPRWLIPWWQAYHEALGAQLHFYVGRVDGEVVCLAPMYLREAKYGPGARLREVRLLGDAGPRPRALDLLVEPGRERELGGALARELANCAGDWDVLELEPLHDPSPGRAHVVQALDAAGFTIESKPAAGGVRRISLGMVGDFTGQTVADDAIRVYEGDRDRLRKGLSLLRRLSRLEWAERDEASPLADPEASALLQDVVLAHDDQGSSARLVRLDDSSGEAVAIACVIDDHRHAIVVGMAVDPACPEDIAEDLLSYEASSARERGCDTLDVVTGIAEYPLPHLPTTRRHVLNLRAYSTTSAAKLARTYGVVRRRVEAARELRGAAAAGARATWAKIRGAAVHAQQRGSYQLYRGQLWVRGVETPKGLGLALWGAADYDNLDGEQRTEFLESLELDEPACKEKWQRGDLTVYATLHGVPAGVAWCARRSFEVPELHRRLRLDHHDVYIYDVFVAPAARGRAVAPAMLEFLTSELRQRDIYRSWALIAKGNVASIRAFEKASYTAVADIVVGRKDRLTVRPPDQEAKALLGMT